MCDNQVIPCGHRMSCSNVNAGCSHELLPNQIISYNISILIQHTQYCIDYKYQCILQCEYIRMYVRVCMCTNLTVHTAQDSLVESLSCSLHREGPNGRERSLSPFTSRLLRRKMMKKIPLWIKITRLVFVTFLGILVIVFTVMAHVLTSPEEPDSCANQPSGTYLFDYDQGDFRLCHSGEERLRGKLGHSIFSNPAIGVSKEIKGESVLSGSAVHAKKLTSSHFTSQTADGVSVDPRYLGSMV